MINRSLLNNMSELLAELKDAIDGSTPDSIVPQMVNIPEGSFMMGDNSSNFSDERPEHRVSMKKYRIGKYPVTFKEYDAFCEATDREKPDDSGWGRGEMPVINVSLYDCQAYCAWLSEETGRTFRLPTEEEWEYAAKAGKDNEQPSPLDDYAWYRDNSGEKTHPVGQKKPNAWGLHDTLGNVFEWTSSKYKKYS